MSRAALVLSVLLAAGSLFPSASSGQANDAYVVIVHPDNPARSISKKKVSRLLLKELAKWGGGLSAEPVDQGPGSDVRAAFSRDVHGRSVASIKQYWQGKISSGEAAPPPELDGDAAVIDYVKSNPGAIGYISASRSLAGAGVKVLDLSSE